jgi:hypothetical protein
MTVSGNMTFRMARSLRSVFFELPAEGFGLALAALIMWQVPLGGIGEALVGFAVPAAAVGARWRWFPHLFPTRGPRAALTLAGKVKAYALTIVGGVIALVLGALFFLASTDEDRPEVVWPILVVALVAAWMCLAGLRRLA